MANESLRIRWRGLPQSPVSEAFIRAEAARLTAWYMKNVRGGWRKTRRRDE